MNNDKWIMRFLGGWLLITLIIYVATAFIMLAQAAFKPVNLEMRNQFSSTTLEACEARAGGECFECPREHYNTGCIDFRLQTVTVDDKDKPIIECEEVLHRADPYDEKSEDSYIEDCRTVGYEQKEVEKMLPDEQGRAQRIASRQAKRQYEQKMRERRDRIDKMLMHNEGGEFSSDEDFEKSLNRLKEQLRE